MSNVGYGDMQIIGENLVLRLETWIKRTVQMLLRKYCSAENRILKSISKLWNSWYEIFFVDWIM